MISAGTAIIYIFFKRILLQINQSEKMLNKNPATAAFLGSVTLSGMEII